MPKTKRDKNKRIVAQAVNDLKRGAENILYIEQQFRPVHPDMADFLCLIVNAVVVTHQMIDRFCDVAWGGHPEDYETWRNERKGPASKDSADSDEP